MKKISGSPFSSHGKNRQAAGGDICKQVDKIFALSQILSPLFLYQLYASTCVVRTTFLLVFSRSVLFFFGHWLTRDTTSPLVEARKVEAFKDEKA